MAERRFCLQQGSNLELLDRGGGGGGGSKPDTLKVKTFTRKMDSAK